MATGRTHRTVALVALATLAAVAISAGWAMADVDVDDWTLIDNAPRVNETIIIRGTLTLERGSSLQLEGCTLRFEDGGLGDARIYIRGGSLILDNSTIETSVPGRIVVDGHMEVRGTSRIDHMDIMASSGGTLTVKDADLTLRGRYDSVRDTDPLVVDSDGTVTIVDSNVHLENAFIFTEGPVTITRSLIEADDDYGKEYETFDARVQFREGTVSAVDSSFEDLWHGIVSQAEMAAVGCTFNSSDLRLFGPWWHTDLYASVRSSNFDRSDLVVEIEETRTFSLEMDIAIIDTVHTRGILSLDLNDSFDGELLIDGVTISGHHDFAVMVKASGFNGTLALRDIKVLGQRGMQVSGDFSNLEIIGARIDTVKTAMDFIGPEFPVPALLDDIEITADVGIVARNSVLRIINSDLSDAVVPVRVAGGATLTLIDTLLDATNAELVVDPGQDNAHLNIERHLAIETVRWDVTAPVTGGYHLIEDGSVRLYTPHVNASTTPFEPWEIGSEAMPQIRLLEWTLDDRGGSEKLAFDEVWPEFEVEDHIFKTSSYLDPWKEGSFDLVFVDDADPSVSLDSRPNFPLTEPVLNLKGTAMDLGVGIESLQWVLKSSTGEEVDSGQVDITSWNEIARWRETIMLTGNLQVVTVVAVDKAGNVAPLTLTPITVDVPTPALTIISPLGDSIHTETIVEVRGSVGWYGNEVEVHVLGSSVRETAQVLDGKFGAIIELPNEGFNQIIVSSFDPYDGTDEKWIPVTLDTMPPLLEFNNLDPKTVNYVTTSSLIVEGHTDDPKAVITVLGQQVGLVGTMSFATTVQLAEGLQTIRVTSKDAAGNHQEVDLRVILDTKAPEFRLIYPRTASYYSQVDKVIVEIEPSEKLSELTVNGEEEELPYVNIFFTVRLRHDSPTMLTFSGTDLAGNVGTLVVTLELDTIEPTLTMLSPTSGTVLNSTTVNVVARASEPGCTLSFDGKVVETKESYGNRLMGRVHLNDEDGLRHVSVTLTDRAGNTVEQVLLLDVDTTPPFISLRGISNGSRFTTEPLDVRGTTEPGAKVVWVNGIMADVDNDGEFKARIQLREGWQNITVKVVDRAGNENPQSFRVKGLDTPTEIPAEALAGGTIIVAMGALIGATEVGRWALLLLFMPLYTKLRKDKILDQRTRGLIQGYVTANPGCNYTIIRDNLSLADGTLTYHLQVLEREGFIYSIREGLFRCFYPHGIRPPKRGKLHLSDTQMDIVRICKRIPGITVGEIATAMNRRPNVISYHLKLLKEGGLVRVEEDGRHVRVYPVESAVAMI
jgi:DNA-binding transcriptional ArsR family regulator